MERQSLQLENTSSLKKKFIAIFIPLFGLLIGTFSVMLRSFKSDDTWRIVFATIGFIVFFVLTGLFVYSMIGKMRTEGK